MSKTTAMGLLGLGGSFVFFILFSLRLPDNTFLWREIHNAGHTPLFGILSLIFLGLSAQLLDTAVRKRPTHYLIALLAALFAGAGAELLQKLGSGDADILDWARDIAGIISFLGVSMTLDPMMEAIWRRMKGLRELTLAVALLTLVSAFIPLGTWTMAYIQRNRAFPKIAGLDSSWERKFITAENADLAYVPAPAGWHEPATRRVMRLRVNPAAYPGLKIEEPFPDWTDYTMLCFDVYSELKLPVSLTLRMHDVHHRGLYEDRYNHVITVNPGLNHMSIALGDVRRAPASRFMDMKTIKGIVLFAASPPASFTVYLDNFVLRR